MIDAGRGGVYVYCLQTLWHARQHSARFVRLPLPGTAASVAGMVVDPRRPGTLALVAYLTTSCPRYIDIYGNVIVTRAGVFVTHDDGTTWHANDDPCVPLESIAVGGKTVDSPSSSAFEGAFAFDGSGRLLKFGGSYGLRGLAVLQSTIP